MENTATETWELDFEWLRVRHLVKDALKRDALPDLNAILYLIGIQELGRWKGVFTKEEKQDLMHIAVCRLLSTDGYYEFVGRDDDGWPHYNMLKPFTTKGVKEQSEFLKKQIIHYFKEWEANS
ncbi:MAG: hypothetical protein AAFZ15_11545 [Bacteroidota bacterium]